jgi:hypothetical protein
MVDAGGGVFFLSSKSQAFTAFARGACTSSRYSERASIALPPKINWVCHVLRPAVMIVGS